MWSSSSAYFNPEQVNSFEFVKFFAALVFTTRFNLYMEFVL